MAQYRRRDGEIVEFGLQGVERVQACLQASQQEFAADLIIGDLRDAETVTSVELCADPRAQGRERA